MVKHNHNPDNCTTCTICITNCPVAAATRKFRGPKMTGPAFERFRLLNKQEDESLSFCSNCKNCDISCPSGVPVSTINMLARAEFYKTRRPAFRDWMVSHGEMLANWTDLIPAFLKNFGMNNPVSRFGLDLLGIHKNAPLPNFAKKTFRKRFKELGEGVKSDKKVVFYPGCYVNVYDPQIGVDIVELLRMAGYEVLVPKEFICCGLPLISNGFANEADKHAKQNSQELAKWTKLNIPVLTGCPSCSLMLKQEYYELYPWIPETKQNAENVADACEFIINLIESGKWTPKFTTDKLKVMYHAPCHLRAQGIGKTGLDLARMVDGVDVTDADAGCCGISGSYGFKKDKYMVSMKVGSELFNKVNTSDAEFVISECGTCQVQLRHGTGREVMHPISLLRRKIKE